MDGSQKQLVDQGFHLITIIQMPSSALLGCTAFVGSGLEWNMPC
jgi:hypothetical protein